MSANGGKADMQRWSCFKKENEAQAELGREFREVLDATGLTCQLDDASLAQQICYDMIVDSRRRVVATSKSAIYEPPKKSHVLADEVRRSLKTIAIAGQKFGLASMEALDVSSSDELFSN